MTCTSPVPSRTVAKHSLPPVRDEDDPPRDADPHAGGLVGLEVGVRGAEVGDGGRARERHRERVDAALAHPLELVPAYAHLLGQLVAGRVAALGHLLLAHRPRLPTARAPLAK